MKEIYYYQKDFLIHFEFVYKLDQVNLLIVLDNKHLEQQLQQLMNKTSFVKHHLYVREVNHQDQRL